MNTTQKLEEMLKNTDNDLTKYVINDILDAGTTEEQECYLKDIMRGGCQSGIVSDLIYYTDTRTFYIKYMDEIEELKQQTEDNLGEPLKIESPMFNWLAWFGYEETAHNIINELELYY